MPTNHYAGVDSLLTPENFVLLFIDHQYLQLMSLTSHKPATVVNNATAVAKAALASGFLSEWARTAFQQRRPEGREPIVFGLSTVLVFLPLAALYESWAIPFAVVLAIPLGILSALVGIFTHSYAYDVYTQIGIVTLIGLAAKNAILIVEFAKRRRDAGFSAVRAALAAARLPPRPILMTSFACIIGVLPLVTASGAGAGARRALGRAVFAGMTTATMLAIVIVPVLYVVIQKLAEGTSRRRDPGAIGLAATLQAVPAPHVVDCKQAS